MTVPGVVQSRAVFFLLLTIWLAGIAACVVVAVRDPELALRHPAVTGSAALTVGWMVLGWAAMRRDEWLARWIWTFGFANLLVHLVFAFGLAHGWSHAAAVEHVRTVGGSGAGIAVNYLFAMVWCLDVVWWWAAPRGHAERSGWITAAIHGSLAFVVVNAAVVFGPDERRLAYCLTLIVLAVFVWRGPRSAPR